MGKRKRRSFTREYKAEVVGLVRSSGKSVGQVARELDLTETAVQAAAPLHGVRPARKQPRQLAQRRGGRGVSDK